MGISLDRIHGYDITKHSVELTVGNQRRGVCGDAAELLEPGLTTIGLDTLVHLEVEDLKAWLW